MDSKSETVNKALPMDLKRKNRQSLLDIILKRESFTVNELSEETGLSRQTIVKSINFFLDKGLIMITGKGVSTDYGGKRPELYQVNANHLFFIAVCFSFGSIAMALLNFKGEVIDQLEVTKCDESSLPKLIETINELAKNLAKDNQKSMEQIKAMTFCVAGAYDHQKKILHYNVFNPSWGREIMIEDELKKIIKTPSHLFIEHVGKSAALSELVKDHSLLLKDVIVIYTSIGVSSTHLDHGMVQSGANALVGEIGHMIVDVHDSQRCACGSYGCFERMICEERMIQNAKAQPEQLVKSVLGKANLSLQAIFDAANQGDEYAQSLLHVAVAYFAIVIRNLIVTSDPDTLIIQGIYAHAGNFFEQELMKQVVDCQFYPQAMKFDLRYSQGELWQLSITGSAHAYIQAYLKTVIDERD